MIKLTGKRIMVYDPRIPIEDFRPCIVVREYKDRYGRSLMDVRFDHSLHDISHGHFKFIADNPKTPAWKSIKQVS